MRIPETISPLRCKVTTGLAHFSGSEPDAPGAVKTPLGAFMEVNVVSCDTAATGTNGMNDLQTWRPDCVNYNVAALMLSKTVTRRFISSAISTLGMGTVAP